MTQSAFPKTRTKVYANGTLYLIDLKSTPQGRTDIARIIDPVAQPERVLIDVPDSLQTPKEVALVRHAAQSLYAPARLIPGLSNGIYRTATKAQPIDFPLVRHHDFDYELLGEWSGHGLYISAILATNTESQRVDLDPRWIRGQWKARAMQHPWVGAAGEVTDHTTLYLLSTQPLLSILPAPTNDATQEGDADANQ